MDKRYKHGLSNHELYSTYFNMINRCYNKNNKKYKYYGGKGIEVQSDWINDVSKFIKDIKLRLGNRPEGHTLDRIDSNGNYDINNLKWSNRIEQNINTKDRENITNNRNIIKNHGSYFVQVRRNKKVRHSKSFDKIEDDIKLRDEWINEYKEDKDKWEQNTITKNYKRSV